MEVEIERKKMWPGLKLPRRGSSREETESNIKLETRIITQSHITKTTTKERIILANKKGDKRDGDISKDTYEESTPSQTDLGRIGVGSILCCSSWSFQ